MRTPVVELETHVSDVFKMSQCLAELEIPFAIIFKPGRTFVFFNSALLDGSPQPLVLRGVG